MGDFRRGLNSLNPDTALIVIIVKLYVYTNRYTYALNSMINQLLAKYINLE